MQAIFFDADGVLYTHGDRQAHLRAFLARHGIALPLWEQLRAAITVSLRQATIGAISRDALYDAVLAACGLTDPGRIARGREAIAADDANIVLYDGVRETLPILAARGLKLGVVTNSASSADEKRAWLRSRGVGVSWDCFISSYDVGVSKPDLAIYRLALARCGIEARDAVFAGHSASDLRGAREAGLATIAVHSDPGAQADVTLGGFADLLSLPLLSAGKQP